MMTPPGMNVSRRFVQMRLRTFLIICLSSGLLGGAISASVMDIQQTLITVRELEKGGSSVYSNFHSRYGLFPPQRKGVWRPLFEWTVAEPDEIYVNLQSGQPTLKVLERLAELPSARCVVLSLGQVVDDDLATLPQIRGLEEVRLFNSAITDRGMSHLAKIPRLKQLDLSHTDITDASLPYLLRMPLLAEVRLESTKMSKLALQQLRAARPNLKIEYDLSGDRSQEPEEYTGTGLTLQALPKS